MKHRRPLLLLPLLAVLTATGSCSLVSRTETRVVFPPGGPAPDPLPQPIVERANECGWGDGLRHDHRGPSPVASERHGTCERQHNGSQWRGCVHLDLTRVGCINGCSECLAHIVGDDSPMPRADRFDHCWPGPDPGHAGPEAGCSVAFGVDASGWSSAGTLHPFPAPTYDCELIDGVCTEVPWPADAPDPAAQPAAL